MIDFLIDYFRITVHTSTLECVELYKEHFQDTLGGLQELAHGAKGFKGVFASALGFQLKHTPGAGREYCTFEFPGKACKAVPPEFFRLFYSVIERKEIRFNVTRIDLAFDGVSFSPEQFYQTIMSDVRRKPGEKEIVRSLTQRNSLNFISEPFKDKEDGSSMGRETCYFGSRQSERYLRIYNKRGPTRLEVEFKGDRAGLVANALLGKYHDEDQLFEIAISHLRDFIDIDLPWWHEFVKSVERAYAHLHDAKEVSLDRKEKWMLKQVAPTYAAIDACTNGEFSKKMKKEGRKRMYKSCAPLLSLYGKKRE
jgi:DNA relaxase NicK